jgi:hypothetical protein
MPQGVENGFELLPSEINPNPFLELRLSLPVCPQRAQRPIYTSVYPSEYTKPPTIPNALRLVRQLTCMRYVWLVCISYYVWFLSHVL